MDNTQQLAQEVRHIRTMMEQSSRFVSLSGWAGVAAGLFCTVGVVLGDRLLADLPSPVASDLGGLLWHYRTLIGLAMVVMVAAGVVGFVTGLLRQRRMGLPLLTKASIRMAVNFLIPLGVGGAFCLLLLPVARELIPAAMLVFYGLACLHASKYSIDLLYSLGLIMCALGVVAGLTGANFWLLILGFGVLHIAYGLIMFRNEKAHV